MDTKYPEDLILYRRQYLMTVCSDALHTFGLTAQTIKAIEELAELQVEIAKTLNLNHRKDCFRDEIADVEILIQQMKMAYFPTWESLQAYEEHKMFKLESLENAIKLKREKIENKPPCDKS